jgi:hypothetical protein
LQSFYSSSSWILSDIHSDLDGMPVESWRICTLKTVVVSVQNHSGEDIIKYHKILLIDFMWYDIMIWYYAWIEERNIYIDTIRNTVRGGRQPIGFSLQPMG